MPSFEQAFGDTEKAAASTLKSATELSNLVKALRKAAKEGNVAAIRRATSRLNTGLDSLRQEVANAVETWPFGEEEEEQYLQQHYAEELRLVSAERGHKIDERDGTLISHPHILRILPGSRSVRIDRKQVSTLRPSYLAEILANNRNKKRKFKSGQFLEALYRNYGLLAKEAARDRLMRDPVVPLSRIYEQFTSLPGSNLDYDKTDFAHDLYSIEAEGTLTTKSGARVSFEDSTSARSARGGFQFVTPQGQLLTYHGIRFFEGS